jgi:hypothetical protein
MLSYPPVHVPTPFSSQKGRCPILTRNGECAYIFTQLGMCPTIINMARALTLCNATIYPVNNPEFTMMLETYKSRQMLLEFIINWVPSSMFCQVPSC